MLKAALFIRLLLPIAAFIFSGQVFSQSMANGQAAGFDAAVGGQSNSSAAQVNVGNANSYIPGYSSRGAPPNPDRTSLGSAGSTRNAQCDQQGIVSGGGMNHQECNVSNSLRQDTNHLRFAERDNILQTAANVNIDTVLGSTVPSKTCQSQVITNPAVTQQQTCNDAITSYTSSCSVKYIPTLMMATNGFTQNPGYSVGPWSAQTFNYTVNINGIPNVVMLTRYQVDNYGQIWINDQLVFQNTLGGMTDMRNGYVYSEPYSYDPNADSWSGGGTAFVNGDGTSAGFYDDGCNWGCRGTSPNLNLTSYFHTGENKITLVCANANGIGPCTFNISMDSNVVAPTSWVNGCQAQEALQ